MVKMVRLDPKVFKAYQVLLDQWVTKDPLESQAKMECQEDLETWDQEEMLAKMVHLVNQDLQGLLDLWEREAHLELLEQEGSKECLVPLENLENLEKMEWLDCLVNLV